MSTVYEEHKREVIDQTPIQIVCDGCGKILHLFNITDPDQTEQVLYTSIKTNGSSNQLRDYCDDCLEDQVEAFIKQQVDKKANSTAQREIGVVQNVLEE